MPTIRPTSQWAGTWNVADQSSAANTSASPASVSDSVLSAIATAMAPASVPTSSTPFPNHTGTRTRARASNTFRSIRPACSAQWCARTGSAFTSASRRQNPRARRSVCPASTAASMRSNSAG